MVAAHEGPQLSPVGQVIIGHIDLLMEAIAVIALNCSYLLINVIISSK